MERGEADLLNALISDAGYKRPQSKNGTAGKGKGKGKGKAKQRRSKSDDKYTGTASELIAKFKPQYSETNGVSVKR